MKKVFAIVIVILILLSIFILYKYLNNDLPNIFLWVTFLADITTIITAVVNHRNSNEKNNKKISNLFGFEINNDWVYEKYYQEFIGRFEYRDEITSFFSDSKNGLNTLLLYSMGGLGKTALCRQILDDISKKNIYKGFIWLQNKNERYLIQDDEFKKEIPKYSTYEDLVNDTFNKLKIPDRSIMDLNQKEKKLNDVFSRNNLLLIIDGLEEKEKTEKFINEFLLLFPKDSKTKLLINSRINLEINAKHIELLKFLPDESIEFMKSFASERSELSIYFNSLTHAQVDKINQITFGNPLLIKVFLSHLFYADVDNVFERYTNYEFEGLNDYLLDSSWKYLKNKNPLAIEIMFLLARYQEGLTSNRIFDYFKEKGEETEIVEKSLRTLGNLSLLEINISESYRKFKLHSFIQGYVSAKADNK